MTLVLRYSARSDRGLVRQNNQDAVYAGPRLLALADGMGGHAAGEVASSLVITALAALDEDTPGDDLLGSLHNATDQGNAAITRHVATPPTWRAWAPRSPPSCSPAPGWAWCTSATRGPTCCARVR
jgi:protein phosphatase